MFEPRLLELFVTALECCFAVPKRLFCVALPETCHTVEVSRRFTVHRGKLAEALIIEAVLTTNDAGKLDFLVQLKGQSHTYQFAFGFGCCSLAV